MVSRLILRRQLRPAPPKALTFKDLKIGEVFRRIVGPESVAMICTKVSHRKAEHRLGTTAFDDSTKVERYVIPDDSARFVSLRIGDLFKFAVGQDTEREYMKLGSAEAETAGGLMRQDISFHEPVIFIAHTLD